MNTLMYLCFLCSLTNMDLCTCQTATERAGESERSLKGCFQWFTEHFKRGNTSRKEEGDDTAQVYIST